MAALTSINETSSDYKLKDDVRQDEMVDTEDNNVTPQIKYPRWETKN
jgi:hypothetical protein